MYQIDINEDGFALGSSTTFAVAGNEKSEILLIVCLCSESFERNPQRRGGGGCQKCVFFAA